VNYFEKKGQEINADCIPKHTLGQDTPVKNTPVLLTHPPGGTHVKK
jgi:hypothetical protein